MRCLSSSNHLGQHTGHTLSSYSRKCGQSITPHNLKSSSRGNSSSSGSLSCRSNTGGTTRCINTPQSLVAGSLSCAQHSSSSSRSSSSSIGSCHLHNGSRAPAQTCRRRQPIRACIEPSHDPSSLDESLQVLNESSQQRMAAAEQRRAKLADALQNGLRVVIDCSYAQAAQACVEQRQDRQQQQQQQQQQIWRRGDQQEQAQQGTQGKQQQQQQQEQQQQPEQRQEQQQQQQQEQQQERQQQQQQRRLATGTFIHKELRSVAKQIELSAAINKRSPQPVALGVTSFTGSLAAFAQHMGAAAWPINTHPESLLELYSPNQLVLMSPDAQEPLMTLDMTKVYVIGGIVDKTVQKGLTLEFAQEHGVQAYRLPIKEHAEQLGLDFAGANKRPILTAADVVTAIIEFNRTQDWVVALEAAVPARKRRQPFSRGDRATQRICVQ